MPDPSSSAIERADKLEHELHVHQVELETQNEELRRTQSDLAAARDRYQDLFDFAPIGYFTLDKDGVILECNLTGARMLGEVRTVLKGSSLSRFIMHPDSDRWHLYLRRVLLEEQPLRIEVALRHSDLKELWYGQIDSQCMMVGDQAATMRVTMTDITERMNADAERRIAAIDADEREAERKRVALQLHENLGQRLSAMKMDISSLSPSPAEAAYSERLAGLLASVDGALATVRRITMDLRPPMLDDLGLVAAIDWLVRDTGRRLGVPFTLALCSEPEELGEHGRLAVFRYVQEAVALLVHETGGAHLHVGMHSSEGVFDILLRSVAKAQIKEGNHVMDQQAVSMLEHRARLLGGRLTIFSPRGHTGWLGLKFVLPTLNQAIQKHPKGAQP